MFRVRWVFERTTRPTLRTAELSAHRSHRSTSSRALTLHSGCCVVSTGSSLSQSPVVVADFEMSFPQACACQAMEKVANHVESALRARKCRCDASERAPFGSRRVQLSDAHVLTLRKCLEIRHKSHTGARPSDDGYHHRISVRRNTTQQAIRNSTTHTMMMLPAMHSIRRSRTARRRGWTQNHDLSSDHGG